MKTLISFPCPLSLSPSLTSSIFLLLSLFLSLSLIPSVVLVLIFLFFFHFCLFVIRFQTKRTISEENVQLKCWYCHEIKMEHLRVPRLEIKFYIIRIFMFSCSNANTRWVHSSWRWRRQNAIATCKIEYTRKNVRVKEKKLRLNSGQYNPIVFVPHKYDDNARNCTWIKSLPTNNTDNLKVKQEILTEPGG